MLEKKEQKESKTELKDSRFPNVEKIEITKGLKWDLFDLRKGCY
jgi:hypothetical protein